MTTISTADLGALVCRALMREMDDKPIRMSPPDAGLDNFSERTSKKTIVDQWTVNLLPTPDFVTVSANGKYYGLGFWAQIDIGGVNHNGPEYDYVTYPDGFRDDSSLITGEGYVAKLRAVIERAAKAAEDDYAARVAAAEARTAAKEAAK